MIPNFFPEGRGRELAADDDGGADVPGDSNGEDRGGRVVEGHGREDASVLSEVVQVSPHLRERSTREVSERRKGRSAERERRTMRAVAVRP